MRDVVIYYQRTAFYEHVGAIVLANMWECVCVCVWGGGGGGGVLVVPALIITDDISDGMWCIHVNDQNS